MTSRRRPGTFKAVFLVAGLLAAGACSSAGGRGAGPAPEVRGSPRERRERAYQAIKEGRWNEAIVGLNGLIEEDPGDMRLRMERGYARQSAGSAAAAADEFTLVARSSGEFQAQALEALTVLEAEASPAARTSAVDGLLDAGYDALRKGGTAEAREKFDRALLADPGRTSVRKQLAYMSLASGDPVQAAERFEGVRRLTPLDAQTALELGYVYDSLHDKPGAVRSFTAALKSPDPEVRATAAAALTALGGEGGPNYLDVVASPYSSSRFRNVIANLEAQAGRTLERSPAFSVYLAGRLTRDSRSHSGTVPEVYADNVLSLAPGLRFQPRGFSARLSVESGAALNLLRTAEHPRGVEPETRVVLADYRYWPGPWRTFADLGGTLGYYSRHRDNVIGELLGRGGVRVWDNRLFSLAAYAPLTVIKDGNRDFYNNAVEYGVGGELRPYAGLNLTVRGEFLRGTYMGIAGRDPNPFGASYRETRLILVYAAHFSGARPPPPVRRRTHRLYLW